MRSAVVAVVVAFTFAGCRSPDDPSNLVVTAEVAPSTFRAGTEVAVTLTVTNDGGGSRGIQLNACPDPFLVTTLSGEVVGPGVRTCSLWSQIRELAPGEQYVFALRWNGDRQGAGSSDTNTLLAPGTYLVHALIGAVGGPIQSAPVQITVTQ